MALLSLQPWETCLQCSLFQFIAVHRKVVQCKKIQCKKVQWKKTAVQKFEYLMMAVQSQGSGTICHSNQCRIVQWYLCAKTFVVQCSATLQRAVQLDFFLVLWQCNAVKLACKNIAVFYIVQIQCKFLCKSSGIVEKIQCKFLFKSSLNLCANPVQIVVQIQCKTTKQRKPVRLDRCVRDLLQIFH